MDPEMLRRQLMAGIEPVIWVCSGRSPASGRSRIGTGREVTRRSCGWASSSAMRAIIRRSWNTSYGDWWLSNLTTSARWEHCAGLRSAMARSSAAARWAWGALPSRSAPRYPGDPEERAVRNVRGNMSTLNDNKVALVTGSSRGIGAAIARLFARQGARVAVHGRDTAALAAVQADIERAGRNGDAGRR